MKMRHVETLDWKITAASAGRLFRGNASIFFFVSLSVFRLPRAAKLHYNFGQGLKVLWQELFHAVDIDMSVLIVVPFIVGKFNIDWSFSCFYRLKRRALWLNPWDDTQGQTFREPIGLDRRELF